MDVRKCKSMKTTVPLLFFIFASHFVTISVSGDDDSPVALFPYDDDITKNTEKFDLFGASIGIDIGHSHTRVGFQTNGVVELIPNELGDLKTPNWISFTQNGTVLVGKAAMNANNSIFDIKRLLGREFDDPEVQREVKMWPQKIVNRQGKPYFQVSIGGEIMVLNPEDVFAAFLGRIKDMAENHIRRKIRKATLVIPANYKQNQRDAVKRVASQVGFIEPITVVHHAAAIIAHKLDQRHGERNYLVFHVGGETCQAQVVSWDNGAFECLANKSETRLGGKEFDWRLADHFVTLIKTKYGRKNVVALEKLIGECERVKIALSDQDRVSVEIEGMKLSEPLTRNVFENINADLFEKMEDLEMSALEEAGLKKEDIDSVVLTGESTLIPKVQKLFEDLFGDKNTAHLDPHEVHVKGALDLYQLILQDPVDIYFSPERYTIPVSTGIQTVGGVMTKLIPRRAITGSMRKALFTTNRDNQSTVEIKVLNGEMRLAGDCHEIGRFNLSGISPTRRGVPRIEISLKLDADFIFTVKAEDKASNVSVTKEYWYDHSIKREIKKKFERVLEESAKQGDRMFWLTNPNTPHNFSMSILNYSLLG